MSLRECESVCKCVREKEREKEKIEKGRQRERGERERERERERDSDQKECWSQWVLHFVFSCHRAKKEREGKANV